MGIQMGSMIMERMSTGRKSMMAKEGREVRQQHEQQ